MTYEYACTGCGHEWEAEQSIKADPLKDCPKCEAPTAKRQISRGTGFILKGGGWYSDSYSGGSNKSEGSKSTVSSSDANTKAFHERFEKVSGIKTGGDAGGDSGSSSSGSSDSGSSSSGSSDSGSSSGGSSGGSGGSQASSSSV